MCIKYICCVKYKERLLKTSFTTPAGERKHFACFLKSYLKRSSVFTIGVIMMKSTKVKKPQFLSVQPVSRKVGLYEKFELRIDLNTTFANPFDPEEIDLYAEFTSPGGKEWKIWGFYNHSSWGHHWMVRFAPTEKGVWKYVVKVKDNNGTAQSQPDTFEVIESPHHGFVKISPNKRYLMYDDGTSFYGVGLWYNDGYEQFNGGYITEDRLDELKRRGVNFISFFHTPLETMGAGLGRYDQNRCGRLDQLFEWCEKRNIHVSWNIWFHSHLSQAVWGPWGAQYRHSPYHLIAEAVDLFGSKEAWKYQEKVCRYIIARWGYSRALFLWFIIDEINGTEGWQEGDKDVAEKWCQKMRDLFSKYDPYGRPTTGTQSGGINEWWPGGYRIFDIAAREIYEAQGHPIPKSGKIDCAGESPLQYSYRNYSVQIQNLWKGFNKPVIIGECGWDHTYYEPGTPGYLAMYHNALWVSLANGLCCTPFWWAYTEWINDSVVTNQMRHFANFVSDIDFAQLNLKPAEIKAGDCDAWAMKSDEIVFGWVVNPRVSVAKESFTISGLNDGNYEVRIYHTWRGQYLDADTVQCRDGKLTVTIPELTRSQDHASYIGNDVAFKIIRN